MLARSIRSLAPLVVGLVSVSCRAGGSPVSLPPDAGRAAPIEPGSSRLADAGLTDASGAVAAASTTVATVAITNLLPGRFAIESGAPTRLAVAATIERRSSDGSWRALPSLDLGEGYRLLETCVGAAPSCIEVTPGRPIHPVRFSGMSCSSQCNRSCDKNAWVGPGTFRLVVHGCEALGPGRSQSATGPEFELPEHRSEQGLLRWGLATDVKRATVARLDLPAKGGWEPGAKPESGRVAGLVERPGTPRELDPASVAALLELLRDDKAYDDVRVKRCKVDKLVGVRLYRLPASTAPNDETVFDIVELAFDFQCQALYAAFGGAGVRPREVHATYFDPSRAAWVAFAKRALPDDAEMRALK